jgi:hypothetical protein
VWLILDTVTISLGVEGMVCEEREGRVNIYSVLYYILQGPKVSLPWFLIPWGPENTRALLRTPAFAHIPVVTFSSSSRCLKKRGETKGRRSK